MPWLKIDASDDPVQFFGRHRDYRPHRSRMADWWGAGWYKGGGGTDMRTYDVRA